MNVSTPEKTPLTNYEPVSSDQSTHSSPLRANSPPTLNHTSDDSQNDHSLSSSLPTSPIPINSPFSHKNKDVKLLSNPRRNSDGNKLNQTVPQSTALKSEVSNHSHKKSVPRALSFISPNIETSNICSPSFGKGYNSLRPSLNIDIRSPSFKASFSNRKNSEPFEVDSPKSLPAQLKNEIGQFQIDGFAKKFFSTHKKGLFRRKVPMEELLQWTSESISQPLLTVSKEQKKEVLKIFKTIQKVMKDRPRSSRVSLNGHGSHSNVSLSNASRSSIVKPPATSRADILDIQWILDRGITQGTLRDEIWVQLCKQLTRNPNPQSERLGWELMVMCSLCFPPSKNFEEYLIRFVNEHTDRSKISPDIHKLAEYCRKKLKLICKNGPKGKVITEGEIEQAKIAPFTFSLFGETLENIMSYQHEKHPNLKTELPRIFTFLTKSILKLGGDQSEGIFRVPGEQELITELRLKIEQEEFHFDTVPDCNVPASLLKQWLRELEEPLIPTEFYYDCLTQVNDGTTAFELISRLPEINRKVINYLIQFLQIFADPEVVSKTKMNISNLSMVFGPSFLRNPSENLTEVLDKAPKERDFLACLIQHYYPDGEKTRDFFMETH
jgi:hypothetical protein